MHNCLISNYPFTRQLAIALQKYWFSSSSSIANGYCQNENILWLPQLTEPDGGDMEPFTWNLLNRRNVTKSRLAFNTLSSSPASVVVYVYDIDIIYLGRLHSSQDK